MLREVDAIRLLFPFRFQSGFSFTNTSFNSLPHRHFLIGLRVLLFRSEEKFSE